MGFIYDDQNIDTFGENSSAFGSEENASSGGSTFNWNDIFSNLDDWLNGGANLARSITGNPETTVQYQVQDSSKTTTYLIIGGVILVAIVLVAISLSNRK